MTSSTTMVLPPNISYEFPIPHFCQSNPGRLASRPNLAVASPSSSSFLRFLPLPGEIVSAGPAARRGPSLPPPPRLAWPPNCAIRAPLKVPRAFFRPPLFVAPEHKVTSLLQGPTAESGRLDNLIPHWRILHMLRIPLINYSKLEEIGSSL